MFTRLPCSHPRSDSDKPEQPPIWGGWAASGVVSVVRVLCFALLVAGVAWRDGVVTDPDVLGPAVPVVFLGMATLGFVGHAVFAASALSARRKEQARFES